MTFWIEPEAADRGRVGAAPHRARADPSRPAPRQAVGHRDVPSTEIFNFITSHTRLWRASPDSTSRALGSVGVLSGKAQGQASCSPLTRYQLEPSPNYYISSLVKRPGYGCESDMHSEAASGRSAGVSPLTFLSLDSRKSLDREICVGCPMDPSSPSSRFCGPSRRRFDRHWNCSPTDN